MLNSKEILEQTGISRATLNNYIGWGIVPRPEVLPPGPEDGEAPRIGYFPDDVVGRIADIQRLKKDGWSMSRIAEHFGAPPAIRPPEEIDEAASTPQPAAAAAGAGAAPAAVQRQAPALPRAVGASRGRAPVLTPVAVLVAGLQHSASIWSELPPEEYFELINDIWATADPIFRRCAGAPGKHPADGMVCYFFPQPAGNYLWNALSAAHELRDGMRRISKDWQLRKGWPTDLYMNIGIDEGQEWLGSFKAEGNAELTALAGTLQHAAGISDFSRFGAIWATKNLVGKLGADERRALKYGVRRKTADGRHVLVPSVFSKVQRLQPHPAGAGGAPRDIAQLPITEIVEIGEITAGRPR